VVHATSAGHTLVLDATSAAEKLKRLIDPEVLSDKRPSLSDFMKSFLGSKAHVLVRFGRWEEILNLELITNRKTYCVTQPPFITIEDLLLAHLDGLKKPNSLKLSLKHHVGPFLALDSTAFYARRKTFSQWP
jgi:hypothetical protein